MEEPTRNTDLHLQNKAFFVIEEATTRGWGESEGGSRDEEIGDWGWVDSVLFDAATELARGASAPREELESDGVV